MRRLTTPPRDGEQGAIAVIVALLLIPLVGFAAYAVDVAAIYDERRQLQNAADAGALVVAEDCAKALVPCVLAPETDAAQRYADANSSDATSAVENVSIDHAARSASVQVRSRTPNGGTGIRHWFAGVLGKEQSTVRASATARWNVGVQRMPAFPLTFCIGEWNLRTQNGTVFDAVPYAVIYHDPGKTLSCALDTSTGPNSAYPGGFGWLQGDQDCVVPVAVGWTPGLTGVALPSNSWGTTCAELLKTHIQLMDANPLAPPLLIPIFDNYRGQGSGGEYHLAGFGAFRPVGFRFSGTHSYPTALVCGSPQVRCIKGWFTQWVTAAAVGDLNQRSYGLTTIQLTK